MVWYRLKQGTTQNGWFHCLHKYRLPFRCSCLWETMQRRVDLSFLSVGRISIRKCFSVRQKVFPSKLGLPPRRYKLMILLRFRTFRQFDQFCDQFNVSNLPPFFVSSEWRCVYKMHKMFLLPLLYSVGLSRIRSGHLVVSFNATHHVVICMNDSWQGRLNTLSLYYTFRIWNASCNHKDIPLILPVCDCKAHFVFILNNRLTLLQFLFHKRIR